MSILLIIILIYICIGIAVNIYGPAAKQLNPEFKKASKPDIIDYAQYPRLQNKLFVYSAIATIRLLIIVAWLPVALITFVEFIIHPESYIKSKRKKNTKKPGLYFYQTAGHGVFECANCGYSQELTSFIHGFGDNSWSKTGYQCQDCGMFSTIERRLHDPENPLICECGGKLTRDEPIFCPICQSKKVKFLMEYIT